MQASIMSIAYLLCTLSWKECYNASKHHVHHHVLTSKESKFPGIVCRSFAVKDSRIFLQHIISNVKSSSEDATTISNHMNFVSPQLFSQQEFCCKLERSV
jgi:hypothetical protein